MSRIFPTTQFGYRKITVERPLRLNFQASAERIARLDQQRGFQNLAKSKTRDQEVRSREEDAGHAQQRAIVAMLQTMPGTLFQRRSAFLAKLAAAARQAEIKLPAPVKRAIVTALVERDETAEICRDADSAPEPDPELRDTERVPLVEDEDPADGDGVPASVRAFFEREVKPHLPDAWIDTSKRDPMDGKVGMVGYEINFSRYFYSHKPPRPLKDIQAYGCWPTSPTREPGHEETPGSRVVIGAHPGGPTMMKANVGTCVTIWWREPARRRSYKMRHS